LAQKKVRARSVPRLNATLMCRRLVEDMARKLPELRHVKAGRILFVAGEARRSSRASVRPLGARGKPEVLLQGRRALYVITLRPRFFRDASAEDRVTTLLHELLHISPRFDGQLSEDRRHKSLPQDRFDALLRPLVRRYLASGDAALLAAMAHDGEVLARQWLERPTPRGGRAQYTEKQLFLGPVRMLTRRRLDS
jgi:predicted metallopeptidase